jgi:subtilisin family serine protease
MGKLSCFIVAMSISVSHNTFALVDPLSNYLWHMGFAGYPNQEYYTGHINLDDTHNYFTGNGVVVVVSDDAVQVAHPDLAPNANTSHTRNYLLTTPPFVGDPSPTLADQSHGTFVSGFIAAKKDNGEGGFGVAPDATLVGFKYISAPPSLAKQIHQTILPEADVFNYSYGPLNDRIYPTSPLYLDSLKRNAFNLNQTYVVAAGNEFLEIVNESIVLGNANYTQDYVSPYTILVGGVGSDSTSALYSTPGSNLWITAPGGDTANDGFGVLSTDLIGCEYGHSNSEEEHEFENGTNTLNSLCNYSYMYGQGTSYSSPIIAGVVALMKQANPEITWREIKHVLAYTSTKNDPTSQNIPHPLEMDLPGHIFEPGWTTNASGYYFHNWYGFGLVDAKAAVSMAYEDQFNMGQWFTTELPDRSSLYKSASALNLNIPDQSAAGVSHTLTVNRHRMLIEHVRVSINITHPVPSELGLELTSPQGTKSVLKYINDQMIGTNLIATFGSNAFYYERAEGNWTLKIIDASEKNIGKLMNWQLFIDYF